MSLKVEIDREADGRWIAEVLSLPGVMAYGATQHDALQRVKAIALRVIADRIEHGEWESSSFHFEVAPAA